LFSSLKHAGSKPSGGLTVSPMCSVHDRVGLGRIEVDAYACKRARCTVDARYSTTLHGADRSTLRIGACLALQPNKETSQTNSANLERVCGTLRVCRGRCKVITHQKFQNGNLREAAKLARNDSAVSAETTMTLARAEMGRKPLDQGLSLRFEKHEVVLQFDMSQLHSQFHQLKSPVNMPFVMWILWASPTALAKGVFGLAPRFAS